MENRVTEQSSAYDNLQDMSIHDILTGINHEDSLVPAAVAKVIPVMEQLVERIVERMKQGGRMFYIGAGTSGRLGVTDASELPPTYFKKNKEYVDYKQLKKAIYDAIDAFENILRDLDL